MDIINFSFGEHVEVSDDLIEWKKAVFIKFDNNRNSFKYFVVTAGHDVIHQYNYCKKSDWIEV